ncbi:uncharacterized protein LOC130769631 [Actinidia eriantha]|uniref:uncharacterized protein LOC130769631 n=1 Tax=Actinidia eriantha TaxID=165200 RepID=UPI00258E6FE0|nr:uncharacterized protein LOC130769631 [Actinidia eriantha]
MDKKLKKAATYFEYDPEEIGKDDYTFRADVTFWPENTYETKDLDLTKPGVRKPMKRPEFEVTSAEVLRKADFRMSIFGYCISSLANILLPIYIWSSVLNCGISNS